MDTIEKKKQKFLRVRITNSLFQRIEKEAGARNVSKFVRNAVEHELDRRDPSDHHDPNDHNETYHPEYMTQFNQILDLIQSNHFMNYRRLLDYLRQNPQLSDLEQIAIRESRALTEYLRHTF